jgi:hypothetical protein
MALNISEWFSTKAFGAAEKTALASCTFKLCGFAVPRTC